MLWRPRFIFNNYSDNMDTTIAGIQGTSVTTGVSNADGTAVSVLPALSHDVHWLIIGVSGFQTANAANDTLLDILIDYAGGTSFSAFIDDLIVGYLQAETTGSAGTTRYFHFPLWIPAGASLGCRGRTAHTVASANGRVIIQAFGAPSLKSQWWCGQKIESLGINAATSKGTNVTPGVSGAYGSWTSIGAGIAGRYGAVQAALQGAGAALTANIGYYYQVGVDSTLLPGSPTTQWSTNTNETAVQQGASMPIFCDIAAGTQLQMRVAASLAAAQVVNCAIYGVY